MKEKTTKVYYEVMPDAALDAETGEPFSGKPRRSNHAWGEPDASGVQHCLRTPCPCERRRPRKGALEWRVSGSKWLDVAPNCGPVRTAPVHSARPAGASAVPQEVAPTGPRTVGELYLSLDDRLRFVMGACVLALPPMRKVWAARVLGLCRARVDQLCQDIRARVAAAGLDVPPSVRPSARHSYLPRFREASHAHLVVRQAAEVAAARFRTASRTHLTRGLCWCSTCERYRPRSAFYPSSLARCGAPAQRAECAQCRNRHHAVKNPACETWCAS